MYTGILWHLLTGFPSSASNLSSLFFIKQSMLFKTWVRSNVHYLGFISHMVIVTAAQLCPYSVKTRVENIQIKGNGCIPAKFCLEK